MGSAVALVAALVLVGIFVVYPMLSGGASQSATVLADIPAQPSVAWSQELDVRPDAEVQELSVVDAGGDMMFVVGMNHSYSTVSGDIKMLRLSDGQTQWSEVLDEERVLSAEVMGDPTSGHVGVVAQMRGDETQNYYIHELTVWPRNGGEGETLVIDAEYVEARIENDQLLVFWKETWYDEALNIESYRVKDLDAGPTWGTQVNVTDSLQGICVEMGIILVGDEIYEEEAMGLGCYASDPIATLDLATGDYVGLAARIGSTNDFLMNDHAVFLLDASSDTPELMRVDSEGMDLWEQRVRFHDGLYDVFVGSDHFYFKDRDGNLAAIDTATGEISWKSALGDGGYLWGEVGNAVVKSTENGLIWVDSSTGELIDTVASHWAGTYVLRIASSSSQLVLFDEGNVAAVSRDPALTWTLPVEGDVSPVAVGEHLVLVDNNRFSVSALR